MKAEKSCDAKMSCPVCGGPLVSSLPYRYRGKDTILKLSGGWCKKCRQTLDAGDAESKMRSFRESVNRSHSDYILKVRKKLGLSQKEAANLFGGGINAFSRYELGKAAPPVSLIMLLRLLDKHPDLLEEARLG